MAEYEGQTEVMKIIQEHIDQKKLEQETAKQLETQQCSSRSYKRILGWKTPSKKSKIQRIQRIQNKETFPKTHHPKNKKNKNK